MRRRTRENDTVSYWKSMVDIITTLMMVVLLILMFFVLSFLDNRNNGKQHDDNDHTSYYDHAASYRATPTPTPTNTPTPRPAHDNNGGGGGGGGGHGVDELGTTPTPVPTVVEQPEGDRAAVHVVLYDEETNKTIVAANVTFELYTAGGSRQTLSTHYPVLESYTEFLTTEDGDFYLPEKIRLGEYYFHQTTPVEGYDYAQDFHFTIDDTYEWNEPYVVRIPLGPSKNNIQVQLNDSATGLGLPGVVFDVVASGDVITPDGTVRYRNGEVVDVITCDELGYGLGSELYLGTYTLVPRDLPFGYAFPTLDSRVVTLEKRTEAGAYAPAVVLESDLTTVRVVVKDEYLEEQYITGMTYMLSSADDPDENRHFITNDAGYFEITGLKKNTTYILSEVDVVYGYLSNNEPISFTVNSAGYIEQSPLLKVDLQYRMLRLEISTIDRILKTPLAGYNVSLVNQNGVVVHSWTSDGTVYKINGIETGVYTLKIENVDREITIVVEDVVEVQKFNASVLTPKSYMALFGVGSIIVIFLGGAIAIVVPKWLKRRKEERRKGAK